MGNINVAQKQIFVVKKRILSFSESIIPFLIQHTTLNFLSSMNIYLVTKSIHVVTFGAKMLAGIVAETFPFSPVHQYICMCA